MHIGALTFLARTNQRGCITVAAWHSRHSLTWRWLLHASRFRGDEARCRWPLLATWRTNHGLNWTLLVPWIIRLDWQVQTPMWYRDLYERQSNERSRLESEVRQTIASAIAVTERVQNDLTLH